MRRSINWTVIILLGLGATMLVAGGFNGEFTAIYLNARILCLSCIGLQ
jgi:hypothetical protein